MRSLLRSLFGRKPAPAADRPADFTRGFRAGFDAAKTTAENRKHWADADGLHPVSQLTPAVRRTLRNRARYEVLNNCYAKGVVSTLAADVVGTGPRLQVLTDDDALNQAVEVEWRLWSGSIGLPDKLRVLEESRVRDGECFALLRTSAARERAGEAVTLDVRLVEADQVGDPWGFHHLTRPAGDDGVECDADGDPVAYLVLKSHPGDNRWLANKVEADRVDAASVIHWFRPDRPGQLRGYTPLAPALNLFAQLRRFVLAVLSSAELAAMVAGVIKTQGVVPGQPVSAAKAFEEFEFVRNMLMTLPAGWELQQLKPEQPITGLEAFVNVILREIGRALDVPFGVVAGDSSRYNYSSARLDHQTYHLRRDVDRGLFRSKVLDRLFRAFLAEAELAIPALLAYRGKLAHLPHTWHYDERPSIDPVKDATTDDTRLANGTTTYAEIYAAKGQDWEEQFRQQAKELKRRRELGLPLAQPKPAAPAAPSAPAEEVAGAA